MNMFRLDSPKDKPQIAAGWSAPLVGDFHKLDRFGEIVFGDEKGEVPPPKADVVKDDKAGKGDKAAKGEKGNKDEKGGKTDKAGKAKAEKKAASAKKDEAAK
jgi:hypothetical protein